MAGQMRLALEPDEDPATYAHAHAVRVRFAETDAMGIVHHGSYIPYLEEARVAYLRAIGHPYGEIRAGGTDIAVIEVHVRYVRPLRFDEVVDVHVAVGAGTRTSFQIAYLLTVEGELRATAVTVHACVGADGGRPQRLPGWLRELADG